VILTKKNKNIENIMSPSLLILGMCSVSSEYFVGIVLQNYSDIEILSESDEKNILCNLSLI